ncbi:DUF262 domain-containing protein [Lysinibacillus sp. LZ02]|uniref:DUF262 domain-containing protein n=1 Tax=Lysinibacillus sp. LZ02 TaxID=3420668 RepID=UPI003D36B926
MANNELKTLNEIFNNSFYRIPDYQRGYAWQLEQLEDFWEDIENLKEDKKHYTGLITVESIKRESVEHLEKWQDDLWMLNKGMKAYYVIDGQQRLTTVIMLINAILSRFNDDEEINFEEKRDLLKRFLFQKSGQYQSFVFGYEKDNPSDEFFKTKILNQASITASSVPEETLYTANLNRAKDFFEKKLKNFSKQDLALIYRKVVNNLKFNLYEIDDDLDVFITFETMNNRGKPLSKLELLKNRLIYLTTLLQEDEDDKAKLRREINDVWKTVYEYLGKNKYNPLSDDNFLRNHWIMYFKYDRSISEAYADFLLNDYFTPKNILHQNRDITIGFSEIKNYIDSIHKSIQKWFYIFNPGLSPYGIELKEWLFKLNRLGYGAFGPLILATLNKEFEEDEIVQLLKSMERFQFLVFRLTRRTSNTKNNHFYRLANDFYHDRNSLSLQSIIEDIDNLTDGEDDEYYYGWFDIDKFVDFISDQYKKGSGFYSWNGLKYFLYEYELHLKAVAQGEAKVSWDSIVKKDSIEHILPQESGEKCWADTLQGYSDKQKFNILHSLGNLVVISQSKNSSLQNKCFEDKKKRRGTDGSYFGFINGSYSEIAVSQYTSWTPQTILERGIILLEFMEERWDIIIEDKEKLLHLDFIEQLAKL